MLSNIIESARHPHEIRALYKLYTRYRSYKPDSRPLEELALVQRDLDFCYSTLGKVSRSFSVVIQQLPQDLRDAVCIFYLVLRALDSIEDDTSIEYEIRKGLLEQFHTFLNDPDWSIKGVGDKKDYRVLLNNFQKVTRSYSYLDESYKEVIKNIAREMGEGMILYLDKQIKTKEEYDEYCYYVAGLVGVGLTDLFVNSGLEPSLGSNDIYPVSMGLFLQKTNIIRDFREDLNENRTFWPEEIWSKYVNQIEELKHSKRASMECLNDMITDALSHAEDCLSYLSLIQNPLIFNFCAIPQVMAIATLDTLYDNSNVYSTNVKIRKGQAADLIFKSTDFEEVRDIFIDLANNIFSKVKLMDPSSDVITKNLKTILDHGRSTRTQMKVRVPDEVYSLTANQSNS